MDVGRLPLLSIAALVFALPSAAAAVDPLPEGHSGIAAGYLGDAGIADDPQVVFADDFEDYAAPDDLQSRWDNVYHFENIALVDGDEGYDGSQSVRLTVPTQDSEVSNELMKDVEPAVDVLFLRYYSKYDPAFDIVGSSHNGSTMSASYWDGPGSGPGIPADGTNKFLVNLEVGRFEDSDPLPGWLNVYVYHPEQRDIWGDHFYPTGIVAPITSMPFDFGPEFVSRPDVVPQTGVWNSYEIMVQANTPGQQDGRIATWIDGELVADWHNLRFRDVADLQMDLFGIGFHAGANQNGECHKWYDHVVAATAYIGPIAPEPGGGEGGSTDGGADDGGSDGAASTGGDAGGGEDGVGDGDTTGVDDGGGSPGEGDGSEGGTGENGSGSSVDDDEVAGCGCRSAPPGGGWWMLLLGVISRRRRLSGHSRERPATTGHEEDASVDAPPGSTLGDRVR